jgi:hypothetical protein
LFRTGDFTEDFGGGLGPDVGLGMIVVFIEIVDDGLFQLVDAVEEAQAYFTDVLTSSSISGRLRASTRLAYVFGNFVPHEWAWTQEDRDLASTMSRYWVNFATTGDPNGVGLPEWPVFTSAEHPKSREEHKGTATSKAPSTPAFF